MSHVVERISENYELHRALQEPIEVLDRQVALSSLRKFETKRKPSGLMRSAWNYAEYGLNLRDGHVDERAEYFHTAQLLTAMVMSHPEVHQDTSLNALTLLSYIPIFSKRASESEISNQDCERVYESLGQAMKYLRPLDIDEPPQWRMVEIASLALSARSRQPHLLLYPASPREESSTKQPLNHDSYFLEDSAKIPIQQKLLPTQKIYDECIKVLTMQPLIYKALKKSGVATEVQLADQVNYLLSLIISETSGDVLNKDELIFLNSMTEAIVAHSFNNQPELVAA